MRGRFGRIRKIHLLIFCVYFVAGIAFFAVGLQPVREASSVYATEAATASAALSISSIDLSAPVAAVALNGSDLEVPEQIAGFYSVHANKTLIIGHSSTIFQNLKEVELGDEVTYNDKNYIISEKFEQEKSEISMKEILRGETEDTLVLMTCSGDLIEGTHGDHTHRLIIYAKIVK